MSNNKKIIKNIFLIIFFFIFISNNSYAGKSGELKVIFINVGDGDAILIITPSNNKILIDAGSEDFGSIIKQWLRKNDINDRIDQIIVTNPDVNHVGGVANIMQSYDIGDIYDPGMSFASPSYEKFLEFIMAKQDKNSLSVSEDTKISDIIAKKDHFEYFNPRAGDVLNWGPDVEAVVLNPLTLYHNTHSDPHNDSIAIKLTYQNISFLFTGNIENEAETSLTGLGPKISATFLKVPNHGSPLSSNLSFLNKVKPKYSIIMVGKSNPYGYPSAEVLENLQNVGSKIYRTDFNGSIVVTTDGINYTITPDIVTEQAVMIAQKNQTPNKTIEASENDLIKEKTININTATADDLLAIEGIGAFKAQMIVRYRENHGAFNSVQDLLKVPGINQAILDKIKDKISLN